MLIWLRSDQYLLPCSCNTNLCGISATLFQLTVYVAAAVILDVVEVDCAVAKLRRFSAMNATKKGIFDNRDMYIRLRGQDC
jgi:hypothetical protein